MEGFSAAVQAGISTITTLMNGALDLATGNELVMIFVSSALIGVGIGVFNKLKNVA